MAKNEANEPLESYSQPANFEQVWNLFMELNNDLKVTDRQIRETWEQIKESGKQRKDNAARIDKLNEEYLELKRETEKERKKTEKAIRELSNLFTSQWGKLIESLVEGDLVRVLTGRGIEVDSVLERRKGSKQGKSYEFDLIAINSETIVIVEVKTTLRPYDVKHFIDKLRDAKFFMPEYKNMNILGGMAFLRADAGSERQSENQGLFVIRATGNSSAIINKADFEPRIF